MLLLVVFQEIPGCSTCVNYGRDVLSHPLLVEAITAAVGPLVADASAMVDAMFSGFRWEAYSDTVEYVICDSYRSPRLHRKLAAIAPATVVFTGGGIVPKSVFAIEGLTLVHVHTGLLPYVRGADVLLWSLLVRGRPGVSAFVMVKRSFVIGM